MVVLRLLMAALVPLMAACAPTVASAASSASCPPATGIVLQVLGSGGPIADDARASSGYLVWVDGMAKVMIDAGGGTFLRFGESGAKFADLDFIGLSHFHTDHSADFPALLKSGSFAARKRSLTVAGPGGGGPFPGLNAFLESMLSKEHGAYGYLSAYLDGSGRLPVIDSVEVSIDKTDAVTVYGSDQDRMQIDALPVPHGIVPALSFKVRLGDSSIVFASDQNGGNDGFIEFAQGASVLVMHMVVPEGVSGTGRRLHAPPSVIGSIAQEAGVDTLVLSHLMARSLRNLDDNMAIIKRHFDGHVVLANDLDCIITTEF